MRIDAIGLDADDTLWHNEVIFEETHTHYCELLSRFHDADTVARTLHATEMRNLELFGYGIKGYALSSIETAISLTQGQISAEEIRSIVDLAKDMMRRPVVLLPGAEEAVRLLARDHDLILITKGDLHDQQRKIARSGLADLFIHTEVVAEKDRSTYARVLKRSRVHPERFIMVGNSIKSDILPILDLGGTAIHVPYQTTWIHERADRPEGNDRFHQIESMATLPDLIDRLSRSS